MLPLFLLQIGLAVGDIQAIYEMANFEKQALQVKHFLVITIIKLMF